MLEGRRCRHYTSGAGLLQQLQQDAPSLLIVALPALTARRDALLRWSRAASIPVLLIAERGHSEALLAALEAGADDFVIAPLRRHALLLRIDILLRRAYPQQSLPQQESFGIFRFMWPGASLTRNGVPVVVTQKEFDLALLLFRHLDRPLSRAFILENLWPGEGEDQPSSRTLDTHMSRVRTKLELQPHHGFRLMPVYGYGYRLERIDPTETGTSTSAV